MNRRAPWLGDGQVFANGVGQGRLVLVAGGWLLLVAGCWYLALRAGADRFAVASN
jgi:hypothetical protein